MTRQRTLLALALATCATTTITTPANAFFHAASYPSTIKATGGTQNFNLAGLEIACNEGKFVGIGNQDSSQLSVHQETFSNCKFLGVEGAAISTTGCNYNFHQAKAATEGQASIVCQPQNAIKFEALGCRIEVSGNPQKSQKNQFLKTIKYANLAGPPKTVTIKTEVSGIVGFTTGCGGFGVANGEHGGGEQKGEGKAAGFNQTGGTVDIEVI